MDGGRFRNAHSLKRGSMHAMDAVHRPIVLVGSEYLRGGFKSTTWQRVSSRGRLDRLTDGHGEVLSSSLG